MWPRDLDDLGGLGGGGKGSGGNVRATPDDLLAWYIRGSSTCLFLYPFTFIFGISLALLVSLMTISSTRFDASVCPVRSVKESMEESWLTERAFIDGLVKFLN